jgi:RND family efflux transporter MFP subunit
MKRWIFVIISLGILGGLIVWRLGQKKSDALAQTQQREARTKAAPLVTVSPATVRDVVNAFENAGGVEAPFNVKLSPKVTGRIEYLVAREGDKVTAGQMLVRIDPTEVEAEVRQREADLAAAQSRLAQASLIQGSTSVGITTEIRKQEAGLSSAKADFNQVKENYTSQLAAAQAAVTDAQGRINSASAAMANADAVIRSAQANLDNAKSKYNRVNDLYKQGFIAAQDVDDARTTVNVQQESLAVANAQLNSAKSLKESAVAQKDSAQRQADIVKTKGKADIEAARARVAQAQASVEFAKANTSQEPAYRANLAALKSAVASAQAALRTAQSHRADTVLSSPISGSVTARYMDPGTTVTPGQPILAVQSMSDVWATVPVPEEVSRHIYVGQLAQVTFDAIPGRKFAGKVAQLNPSADPTSRQFQMRIVLRNAQNLIKPGMYARVNMTLERIRNAVVVPREAITSSKSGPSVMVVNEKSVANRRPVTLGASDTDGIAITSGLSAGEKVIVLSANPVKHGQTVKVGGEKPAGKSSNGAPSA